MTPDERLAELGLDLASAQALRSVALGTEVEGAAGETQCVELERRGLLRRGARGYEPTATGIVVARQVETLLGAG